MSRIFLRGAVYCKSCTNTNSVVNNHLSSRGVFSVFQFVNKCTKRDELGQTLIFVEDGSNIRELPVIVRKVSNDSVIFCENKISNGGNELVRVGSFEKVKDNVNLDKNTDNSCKSSIDLEAQEIIDYINKCYTARGIFAILETIPANEVTPNVALQALKKIVTLENNKTFRNNTLGEVYKYIEDEDSRTEGLHENETFTRTAVLARLVDKILTSGDADILLNGYLIVNRDIIGKYIDQDNKKRFSNEILCRVTDGKFSITQTCEAIKVFSDIMPNFNEDVDKLWIGITEKSNDITKNNLMDVVRSLPYLYKSRATVLSVVEKKLFDLWYTINGHDVAEILVTLTQIKSNSPRILSILSQWINKNIHTATEDNLIEIINGFCLVTYNNNSIEQALERYVKAKGVSIKNPALMGSIMDYCSKFRVRSPVLLQGAAEYVVVHGNSLSPVLLQRLFLPLGKLFYQPSNGFNFWKVLEGALEEKFIQFRPEEAIDMLLHCVYLQKYPLNFVKKVFNPYFLDRLHSYKNKEIILLSRSKLQVLDVAMTLECAQYQGPILPKPLYTSPIWQDGRVKRMVNSIRSVLCDIAGNPDRVLYNIVPTHLTSSDVHVVDALILNKSLSLKMWPVNFEKDFSLHTAVIIHPPENYCSHNQYLLGKQEMRKRHFRYLGLNVVSLDLTELAKLRVHPRALRNYIDERFSHAELPFPRTVSSAKP